MKQYFYSYFIHKYKIWLEQTHINLNKMILLQEFFKKIKIILF